MVAPAAQGLRLGNSQIERHGSFVELSVDGKPVAAIAGETVAAAVTAHATTALRVTNEGASRGIYCGMGVCFDCRVTINGVAGQRSCLTLVQPGMEIVTGEAARRPDGPNLSAPGEREEICDILIIGAGPAGLAAAEAAAKSGAAVMILDERPSSGGQYFKPLANSHRFRGGRPADRQFKRGAELVGRVAGLAVRIFNQALVWDAQVEANGGLVVRAQDKSGAINCRARKLIVATGAYERSWPVPGWTLPGVMTTGAAQTLARSYRVAPGSRVLIAGNGPLNLQVAAALTADGVQVAAVVEGAAGPSQCIGDLSRMALTRPDLLLQGASYLATLRRHRVPLLYSHVLTRVDGVDRAQRAAVAAIDADGTLVPGTECSFEIDAVCTGYGFSPSSELTRLLGCDHRIDPRTGVTLIADRDGNGRTSLADVFVAGDAGGSWGAHSALAQGTLAGLAAANDLNFTGARSVQAAIAAKARRSLEREKRFQQALWRVYAMPGVGDRLASDDTIVCRCESVTFGRVRQEIKRGARDLPTIKRATRCGMGHCQGRYCSPTVAGVLQANAGVTVDETTFFRVQVPVRPVAMRSVARPHAGILAAPALLESPSGAAEPPKAVIANVDILIIGAGAIGLCSALELARAGADVLVVDRNEPHAEASGANAGSLHVQFQAFGFPDMGAENTLVAASTLSLQRDSVHMWNALSQELTTDFEVAIEGGLTVADDEASLVHLRQKVELERAAGLEIDLISGAEARRLEPYLSPKIIAASLSRDEGKLNPLKASPAVRAAAERAGAKIRCQIRVLAIQRAEKGFLVQTDRGLIAARRILNSAGAWSGAIAASVGDAIPIRANPIQMIVTETMPQGVNYHLAHALQRLTLKQAASGNLVIGGGWRALFAPSLKRTRPSVEGFGGNLAVVLEMLPALGALQIIRSWTGTAFTTAPTIGESPSMPGLFHAVTQNGMTLAPAVGKINADLLLDRRPNYDIRRFAPKRSNS
jgi:glycine/D-amino acid oxidase-like deaminating enzyme